MALTYQQIYNALEAGAPTKLETQIAVAIWKASVQVRNEDAATANHTARLAWANKMATWEAVKAEAKKMLMAVFENATIQEAPMAAADSDVQFVVNSLIDTFAA